MSEPQNRPADACAPTAEPGKLSTTFLPSLAGEVLQDPSPNQAEYPPELASLTQYQIVRELGSGGMGRVFLAKDLPLDRDVVIKIVNANRIQRAETLERFVREMRVAAKLHHPNIVTAYTSHQVGEFLAFVMEHVPGIDLAQQVKTRGRISPLKVAYYVSQIARGLKHAHEHDLVHRDVKPSNLMLVKQGKKHVVKILDFGLAKARSECANGEELTGAGCMLGTPEYVAPEQIRDAARADIRADLYSLGCTMYFLLTGAPPFRGRSEFELQEAHVFKQAPRIDIVRPDVPESLATTVAKLMAKEPRDRFQSPAELLAALADYLRASAASLSDQVPFVLDEEPPQQLARSNRSAAVSITKTGLTTTEIPELPLPGRNKPAGPQEVPILRQPLAATPPAMKQLDRDELFATPATETKPSARAHPYLWLVWFYTIATVAYFTGVLGGRFLRSIEAATSAQLLFVGICFWCFACGQLTQLKSRSWWLGTLSLAAMVGLLIRNLIPATYVNGLGAGWLWLTVLACSAVVVGIILERQPSEPTKR